MTFLGDNWYYRCISNTFWRKWIHFQDRQLCQFFFLSLLKRDLLLKANSFLLEHPLSDESAEERKQEVTEVKWRKISQVFPVPQVQSSRLTTMAKWKHCVALLSGELVIKWTLKWALKWENIPSDIEDSNQPAHPCILISPHCLHEGIFPAHTCLKVHFLMLWLKYLCNTDIKLSIMNLAVTS